jgi:hypothetical protein
MRNDARPNYEKKRFEEHDSAWLVLAAAVILAACFLHLPSPGKVSLDADGRLPLPETCWLRNTLKVPCAACGLTRSFVSMARLDLVAAWRHNRVGPFFFLAVFLQIPYRAARILAARRNRPMPRPSPRIAVVTFLAGIVLLLANWSCNLILPGT